MQALAMPEEVRQPYAEDLPRVVARLPAGPDWLDRLRQHGLDQYRAEGLPTRKTEAWKYTAIAKAGEFTHAELLPAPVVEAAPEVGIGLDAWRIVVVNGRFRVELSDLGGLPDGVTVRGLAGVLAEQPARLEAHLGRLLDLKRLPLAALNTAFLADGVFIDVRQGTVLEKPLHLISVGAAGDEPAMFHPRHLMLVEDGAAATLVESHVGTGAYFANSVVEIAMGRDARLNHAKLQDEPGEAVHVATQGLRLAENAAYQGLVLHIGARMARHEFHAELAGPHTECVLNGAFLGAGTQHIDNTTFMDHAAPFGTSRQNFRGVLDDTARGVYQGKALVRRDAQKTDAHQLSKALLLSRGAEMDAKPELEIYADDVKCGHGASTGQLSQDQLFYLRGRGIDAAMARRMLVEAFVAESIEAFPVAAVREAFAGQVTAWLNRRAGA